MHPYLFEIPLWGARTFRLPSYGVMIVCGFALCLWLVQRRGRRMGLNPLALFDAATVALVGGIVGSRLFYVIDNWDAFADSPWRVFFFWKGGLAFYGGLIGGAAGLLGTVWKKKLPLRATFDVVTSLLPLGHAFGRMGCFLNGCCFGKVTESWAGLQFPRVLSRAGQIVGSPPFQQHVARGLVTQADGWSLPVHPTQLYEVGYNLVIFAALSFLLRRRRRPGDIAWLYGVSYGCARFANEFLRGDTTPLPTLGGLTIFQALSIAIVALGLALLLDSARRPPEPIPDPWQPPPEESG